MAAVSIRNLNKTKKSRRWGVLGVICFRGQAGCCISSLPMRLFRLEQTDHISAQQRVMERGLSVFCQAFDGVADCKRYMGWGRSTYSDGDSQLKGEKDRTKKARPRPRYTITHYCHHFDHCNRWAWNAGQKYVLRPRSGHWMITSLTLTLQNENK